MKRRINIFWLIYLVVICLPIIILATLLASVITITMLFIGDYRLCYMPAKYWARLICHITFVRVKIVGREHYSKHQSYIFIANHQSVYDIFVIYGWLINKFKWIMKNTLRSIPVVGYTCLKMGHIFIDRSNPLKAKKSIDLAKEKLRNGSSIVIFAEGSRCEDGQLGQFKRGAFTMAQDLKLPIVPVAIKGTFEVMPKNSYYVKPYHVTVTFHKPINTKDITDNNIRDYMRQTRDIIATTLSKN